MYKATYAKLCKDTSRSCQSIAHKVGGRLAVHKKRPCMVKMALLPIFSTQVEEFNEANFLLSPSALAVTEISLAKFSVCWQSLQTILYPLPSVIELTLDHDGKKHPQDWEILLSYCVWWQQLHAKSFLNQRSQTKKTGTCPRAKNLISPAILCLHRKIVWKKGVFTASRTNREATQRGLLVTRTPLSFLDQNRLLCPQDISQQQIILIMLFIMHVSYRISSMQCTR